MKNKITAILACGAFVFLLAGCQSTPKDQAEATTTQDIATTAEGPKMPQKIQQRLRRPLPTHLTSANMRQKSHRLQKKSRQQNPSPMFPKIRINFIV